ncbi:hypothetical protein LIER_05837 [Lithospermum erythrorhizon]|uniref:Tf2-1-like SH3-like domain-containing protein n=1 Tax=Lithospermum erythrorhizon TaxID=34254 RepID=A0AAV3P4L1_LITER
MYADCRGVDLTFEIGDKVLLRIPPWKGVLRFGKKEKLSPQYIGPYEILDKIGSVAYPLALPPALERIHVFHVFCLRKYIPDGTHILESKPIELGEDLTNEEQPVRILDRKENVLRNKVIFLVNVLWHNQIVEEATWECEEDTKGIYPYLFEIEG